MDFSKNTSEEKIDAAITGIGAITPIGCSCAEILESLRGLRDGIGTATKIDTSPFVSHLLGECQPFDFSETMASDELETFTDPYIRLAISAARKAVADAGFGTPPASTAMVLATCNGGLNSGELEYRQEFGDATAKFDANALAQYEHSALCKAMAGALKIGGECWMINTACSGATAALGMAESLVESGRFDCVLAGGADAASLVNYAGFCAIKVVSPEKTAPFSNPVGMNLGEGAAFWIVENGTLAKKRGAKIYGKIIGHAITGDAHHPTQPDPRGDGAFRTMRNALENAGVGIEKIGCINAHGSGTAANDKSESKGIAKISAGAQIPITSTKSYTGHCMGATGIIEATCQLLAMNDNFVPPTLRNTGVRQGCEVGAVGGAGIEKNYDCFLSANYAFAGNNAAVVVAKDSFEDFEKPEQRRGARVAICGCSAVSSLGIGSGANVDALENGLSGVAKISRFASERFAGMVELPNLRSFDRRIDFGGMNRISTYATIAAKGALDQAGVRIGRNNCESTGLVFATYRGSDESAHMEAVFSNPERRGDIGCFSNITPNSTAGWVSKALEIKGANTTFTSGENSGLAALGFAARLVCENAAERVVAVAADELYKRMVDAYEKFGLLHSGAAEENFELNYSSYAKGVLGEGAAAMLVEDFECAEKRGAKILGEILAFETTSDICKFDSPNLDNDGLLRAARAAVDSAKVKPDEIGLIVWSPRGCAQDSAAVFARDRLFAGVPMLASSLNTGYMQSASALHALACALESLDSGRKLWRQRTGVSAFDNAPLPENPELILCLASSPTGNNYALVVARGARVRR